MECILQFSPLTTGWGRRPLTVERAVRLINAGARGRKIGTVRAVRSDDRKRTGERIAAAGTAALQARRQGMVGFSHMKRDCLAQGFNPDR
jgi:hypothetical protein